MRNMTCTSPTGYTLDKEDCSDLEEPITKKACFEESTCRNIEYKNDYKWIKSPWTNCLKLEDSMCFRFRNVTCFYKNLEIAPQICDYEKTAPIMKESCFNDCF